MSKTTYIKDFQDQIETIWRVHATLKNYKETVRDDVLGNLRKELELSLIKQHSLEDLEEQIRKLQMEKETLLEALRIALV